MATSAPDVTTAYPLPPPYFKLYTDTNVAHLPEYQRNKAESEAAQDPFSLTVTAAAASLNQEEPPPLPDAHPLFLHPPKPVEGPFQMFGAEHNVDKPLKSLQEEGVTQLYPEGSIDYKTVLKKLVYSLLLNLTEYLHVLLNRPEQHQYKIQQIHQILVNIHHLINEYRRHQSRDILRIMLEKQIAKKREMAQQIRDHCNEMREELRQATRDALESKQMDTTEIPSEDQMEIDGQEISISQSTLQQNPLSLLPPPSASNPLEKYKEIQKRLAALADAIS